MDSCHIFNFLFGTRKATTELSKCFSSSLQRQTNPANDNDTSNNTSILAQASVSGRASRLAERLKSSWQSSAASASTDTCGSQSNKIRESISAPSSPLKQLQMRINATFAASPTPQSSSRAPTSVASRDPIEHPTLEEPVISTEDRSIQKGEEQKMESIPPTCCYGKAKDCGTFHARLVESLTDNEDDDKGELPSTILLDNDNVKPEAFEADDKVQLCANRVVLYDDSNGSDFMSQDQYLGSVVAEVYEIGSTNDDATSNGIKSSAQMRRISSITSNDLPFSYNTNVYSSLEKNCEQDTPVEKKAVTIEQRVKNLVQSFESSQKMQTPVTSSFALDTTSNKINPYTTHSSPSTPITSKRPKPITIVKPMPPKTPPKSNKVKCFNHQLTLHKPSKIEQLFNDEKFLSRFFSYCEPLDRCVAAQVCKQWRKVLYSNQNYWKDLIGVIDCTHLRREYLVECILNTLQTAKLKHQKSLEQSINPHDNSKMNGSQNPLVRQQYTNSNRTSLGNKSCTVNLKFMPSEVMQSYNCISRQNQDQITSDIGHHHVADKTFMKQTDNFLDYIDQEDIWRIQELCQRFTTSRTSHHFNNSNGSQSWQSSRQQTIGSSNMISSSLSSSTSTTYSENYNETNNGTGQEPMTNQSHQTSGQIIQASKSTSIPSQISSTLSSVSLSSLLSPLSESSRVDSIKEKLYMSLDDRGFDAICLFGATDDDIDDLISKTSADTHQRILAAKLNNCCITDRGLELFLMTFDQIQELELSGCNEITNTFELRALSNLKRLELSDCINIADGVVQKLLSVFHQLETFVIQSYHLTDAFFEFLSNNTKTAQLRQLELPNCKEITNQSLFIISKHFTNLEALSVSGSTKITDDGIEVLAEQAKCLKSLNLSWCNKITNAALECIACDLGSTLTDLILDRNIHITDHGLGYLATMNKLSLLHIRWCTRITDIGVETLIQIKTLKALSIAGLHQITTRSLLSLPETNLIELELTNCPAVNYDLIRFLSAKMPKCGIVF